jgi:hypothetical protein
MNDVVVENALLEVYVPERQDCRHQRQTRLRIRWIVCTFVSLVVFSSSLWTQNVESAPGEIRTEIIFPGLYGQQLLDSLVSRYKPTSTELLSYDGARDRMYAILDNVGDTVTCVYTGYKVFVPYNAPNPRDYTNAANPIMNAEHTYPSSLFGDAPQPRANLHHLFPTNGNANAARGNLPFDEIADNITDRWWRGASYVQSIPTSDIDEYSEEDTGIRFEPREDHKGNVARAMFYLYTMYRAECDAEDPNFFHIQKTVLWMWNTLDPVDSAEVRRTDSIAVSQGGKKNPFVLDTTLVGRAYFGVVDVTHPAEGGAKTFVLEQNFPNPFNPSTVIEYRLTTPRTVSVRVYNVLGQEVRILVNGRQLAGSHRVKWDGRDGAGRMVSSGVYLYALSDGQTLLSRKMLFLR